MSHPLHPARLHGRTALVTGASAGIGAAFASALARRGADLVLVARRADRLAALAEHLRTTHGVQAHVRPIDLGRPGAGAELATGLDTDGIQVDVLVNNAGMGIAHGPFATADPAGLRAMLDLNVGAVVELTRALLPPMLDRGEGIVVNVASTTSFQPVPYLATYAATKAFVLSWSEAIWAETRTSGVRVLAVCPGMTATEFFDVAGPHPAGPQIQTPEQVVERTLRALRRNRPTVVSGVRNALMASGGRLASRAATVRIAEWVARRPTTPPVRRADRTSV